MKALHLFENSEPKMSYHDYEPNMLANHLEKAAPLKLSKDKGKKGNTPRGGRRGGGVNRCC